MKTLRERNQNFLPLTTISFPFETQMPSVAFSPFPTMFSKGIFLKVVKSQDHLVKKDKIFKLVKIDSICRQTFWEKEKMQNHIRRLLQQLLILYHTIPTSNDPDKETF